MTVAEWIMSGGLLAIIGMVFQNNRDNSAKVRRVYQRLDETKERSDNLYTNKDICEEKSRRLESDVSEIKVDVKELLRRNGG